MSLLPKPNVGPQALKFKEKTKTDPVFSYGLTLLLHLPVAVTTGVWPLCPAVLVAFQWSSIPF